MTEDQRVIELLEELVALTRFTAREALAMTLEDVLRDPRHFEAYKASDGERGQKEIAEIAQISQPTVSNLWAKWRRLGLVRFAGGRAHHLVDPADLGIDVAN